MLRSTVVLVALALATQSASSITPADPSIGSYPWFVALDQRCPQKSASREAALERYKRHLIANIRAIAAGLPESQAAIFLKRADELERTGPSTVDLDRFADIFAKGSAEEIQELCQSFEVERERPASYRAAAHADRESHSVTEHKFEVNGHFEQEPLSLVGRSRPARAISDRWKRSRKVQS